jgi:hypothetical protein
MSGAEPVAAGHDDVLTGDVAGGVRGEEGDDFLTSWLDPKRSNGMFVRMASRPLWG